VQQWFREIMTLQRLARKADEAKSSADE